MDSTERRRRSPVSGGWQRAAITTFYRFEHRLVCGAFTRVDDPDREVIPANPFPALHTLAVMAVSIARQLRLAPLLYGWGRRGF